MGRATLSFAIIFWCASFSGCGEDPSPQADGDIDASGDADGDGDSDVDSDADGDGDITVDGDMDGDSDVDAAQVCVNDEACPEGLFCAKAPGACGGEGHCQPLAEQCTDIFAPVCGCDGHIYQNQCDATQLGQNIHGPGRCDRYIDLGHCTSHSQCEEGHYCARATGSCYDQGQCQPIPQDCSIYEDDPQVCGCDGQTYGNFCLAAQELTSVSSDGPCAPSLPCLSSWDCGWEDHHFCDTSPGCGGQGVCRPMPNDCSGFWHPLGEHVCGCDGYTYGDGCAAERAGVSVDHDGGCEQPLSCQGNDDCNQGSYCRKAAGTCEGEGICEPIPADCEGMPHRSICGCDGNTHRNACLAARASTNVLDDGGACAADTGEDCEVNGDCGEGSFCHHPLGSCTATGQCWPIPGSCPQVDAQVCTCTVGLERLNACEAYRRSESIHSVGPCDDDPIVCSDNDDCGEESYCQRLFGQCEDSGLCAPRPRLCSNLDVPICSCDGQTYLNECVAASAGANIAHFGECIDEVECTDNGDCEESQYCDKDSGACSTTGLCQPRPRLCHDSFEPVCGCDGETYTNWCLAAAAGVNVNVEQACEGLCTTDRDCASRSEYCQKEPGSCRGIGTCAAMPRMCSNEEDPVCGCNGDTYTNACRAASAGQNISMEHACEIYVNIGIGHDEGNTTCHSMGPCRTLNHALTVVAEGQAILISDGVHSLRAGESYPLSVPPNVTLRARGNGAVLQGRDDLLALAPQGNMQVDGVHFHLFEQGIDVPNGSVGLHDVSMRNVGDGLRVSGHGSVFADNWSFTEGERGFIASDHGQLTMWGGSISELGTECAAGISIGFAAGNSQVRLYGATFEDNYGNLGIAGESQVTLGGCQLIRNNTECEDHFQVVVMSAQYNPVVEIVDTTFVGGGVGGCAILTAAGQFTMEGGHVEDTCLQLQGGDWSITGTTFSGTRESAEFGILLAQGVTAVISDVEIADYDMGIAIQEATAVVTGSTITNNRMGVHVNADEAVLVSLGAFEPGQNVIQNNDDHNILIYGTEELAVVAAGNTWDPNLDGADAAGQMAPGTVLEGPYGGEGNFQISQPGPILRF